MQVEARERLGFLCGEGVQRSAEVPSTVCPRWVFPFTMLRGKLDAELLQYLLGAPELARSREEWAASKDPAARVTGFEEHPNSMEVVMHCHSQEHASVPRRGFFVFGLDASQPAPRRVMAFRHSLVRLNHTRLRRLQESLQRALRSTCSDAERKQFGHAGGEALVLAHEAFSVATLQLRWGPHEALDMPRHVDGGPSLLHISLGLVGRRVLRAEAVRHDDRCTVEVAEHCLGPGDVYVTSPACFYHSVHYEPQPPAVQASELSAVVVHLRSNMLRLRSSSSTFRLSNRLVSETLAPVVARALADDPLQLPSIRDVSAAEAELFPAGDPGEDSEDAPLVKRPRPTDTTAP